MTRRYSPITCTQIRIGTRGSPLALAQAYETKRRLAEAFEECKPEGAVEIIVLKTSGDMILDKVFPAWLPHNTTLFQIADPKAGPHIFVDTHRR